MNQSDPPPGSAEPQLGAKLFPPAESCCHQRIETGAGSIGAPTGWYSRGYLPHFDHPGTIQSITFRLADSLPQARLTELEDELRAMPEETRNAKYRQCVEAWLDAGMGCCALRHPALAAVMQETLLRWDGLRYRLIA